MNKIINYVLIVLIIITSFFLNSCTLSITKKGEVKQIEKSFTVSEFKGIETRNGIKIVYTVGDTVTICAKGRDIAVNNLSVVVGKDSILHITDIEDGRISSKVTMLNFSWDECTLYITGPSLSTLNINGSADFESKSTFVSDEMSINVSGAGDIDIEGIIARNFSSIANGAADIDIKALKADNAMFRISGAGDIDVNLIDVKYTKFQTSGAGDIDADFKDCGTADVFVSGAGDIELSGNLRQLNQNISGAGDIDVSDLKIGQ